MNQRPRAGLLPLFLKLYDETLPDLRRAFDPFLASIEAGLVKAGIEVAGAPVCCVESEFAAAVADLEKNGVDALVCLHLAYSPSLESADVLVRSRLPLVLLDTTPDAAFGRDVDPQRLLYNHGIHGVQDLACMLRRRGREFEIAAGHWAESDVLGRAAELVRAAHAARRLRSCRALRVGRAFAGMGDFAVDDRVLAEKLGVSVKQIEVKELVPAAKAVTKEQIDAEMRLDRERFDGEVGETVHRDSLRVGLALRRVIEEGGFGAFSVNFQAFDTGDGPVCTVPFLEISKAMARGIGYAGEGDVLTAALVAALLGAWPRTTFTEIFCPDWRGDSLFLSHMGEINPAVAAGKALLSEKDFPFTPAKNPAIITCAPEPGPATFVNLAPGPGDTFRLIAAAVEVLGDGTHPAMRATVRGWMRPRCGVARFLEEFSRCGGTHHSALVLGQHVEAMAALAKFAGLESCSIA